mgnify:CR=1 FL=1
MLVEEGLGRVLAIGSGDPDERIWAQKILPLRDRGNLLLCTLLLGNTLVNALIAVLLADARTAASHPTHWLISTQSRTPRI